MGSYINETCVKAIEPPTKGYIIHRDGPSKRDPGIPGFGVRVTRSGAKSFILGYRSAGRERRITIGKYPTWSATAARAEAADLRRRIDQGEDPAQTKQAERTAPTVDDLIERYIEVDLHKRRKATQEAYRGALKHLIASHGKDRLTDVRHHHVLAIHTALSKDAPTAANQFARVTRHLFNLAIKWELCTHNPARGVEMNPEERRERYLSADEVQRLLASLASAKSQQNADVIRLLLLTGARKMEVLAAEWEQFDLDAGIWTKPSSHTKQKRVHRVPLSAPALQLLTGIKARVGDSPFLFPGRGDTHIKHISHFWKAITADAGIERARPHDLRHTYASFLASSGQSLPIIGALLGHTQQATTARYAHLLDDPLKAATDRVGAIVTGADDEAEVIELAR